MRISIFVVVSWANGSILPLAKTSVTFFSLFPWIFFPLNIESDWTFFHLVLSTPADYKKLKILQIFFIRVGDHRLKLEQKIGTENPMRGFNFVPIRPYFPEWKSALTRVLPVFCPAVNDRQENISDKFFFAQL